MYSADDTAKSHLITFIYDCFGTLFLSSKYIVRQQCNVKRRFIQRILSRMVGEMLLCCGSNVHFCRVACL